MPTKSGANLYLDLSILDTCSVSSFWIMVRDGSNEVNSIEEKLTLIPITPATIAIPKIIAVLDSLFN